MVYREIGFKVNIIMGCVVILMRGRGGGGIDVKL